MFASESVAVMRTVPEGPSVNDRSESSSSWISDKRGPTVDTRRSPASVSETLRVERTSRGVFILVSSARTVRLSAD
ncbi:hypothetical protein D3C85_967050 [compost metagenome]